jgi:hypothetical protein
LQQTPLLACRVERSKGKEHLFLRISHSGPGHRMTWTPGTSPLRCKPCRIELIPASFPHKFGEFQLMYFRKLHNVLRLAESGIKRAQKSTLTDAFGWLIARRMGQSRGKTKGRPVLGARGINSLVGYRCEIWLGGACVGVPPAYAPTAKPPPPHDRLHPQAKEKRNRSDDLVIPGTREDFF